LRRLPSRARRRDHALAEAHERSVNTRPQPRRKREAFSPDQKKRLRRRSRFCRSRGGLRAPGPRRIGASWDVPSGWDPVSRHLLDSSPFGWFSAPLHRSGGSGRRWARARSVSRGGGGGRSSAPSRITRSGRLRRPLRETRSDAGRYSGDSSSPTPEAVGSSGGTVTFSGVTSPGMKVMSTSSPGSPSSPCLRPTRIVEPGSIARPRT